MNLWEFMKHAVGGGVAVAYAERRADKKIKKLGLDGEEKNRVLGTTIGGVGGGFLGYYIGEKIANHDRNYTIPERIVSTAVGSAGGSAAGYVIANYLSRKMRAEKAGTDGKNDDASSGRRND